ncbi:MAG TPA: 3-isopropylmalate dehydrogenase [Bacillales bacterium]|nr:3-isopropylmalate dehydrogenase [Bacillales bacterium]
MKKQVAVLPGDGIGQEVANHAVKVLKAVGRRFGHTFDCSYAPVGGDAVDKTGKPLPEETLELCRNSDAVLFGAVGGPKWDSVPVDQRPEKGLLQLRKSLELFCNLRPVKVFSGLSAYSSFKSEAVQNVDFVIVRELTGGLYFGKPSGRQVSNNEEEVVDTLYYKRREIERIVDKAFRMAAQRGGKVTSVDKANVLESSRLWREIADETAKRYPDVRLEHMLVDRAAMELIGNPRQFDVIVTENMFGDILSDEASMLTGSLGLLPSASLSENGPGLYEPVHGSAPDIAGENKANPLASILSVAMMLRHSFRMREAAEAVEKAVAEVLASGYRTEDIAGLGQRTVGTKQMAEQVLFALEEDTTTAEIMAAYA